MVIFQKLEEIVLCVLMQQPICRKASSIIHKKDLNYNEYSFGLERETKNIINRGFPTIAKYILKRYT